MKKVVVILDFGGHKTRWRRAGECVAGRCESRTDFMESNATILLSWIHIKLLD